MDAKVYKKETVYYDKEREVPVLDVIDFMPVFTEDGDSEKLTNIQILEDADKGLVEQQCALATIWQRGLDPLDSNSGVQWAEVMLGEINAIQIMEQIVSAVENVASNMQVVFDTLTNEDGEEYLTYSIEAVA